MAASVRPSRHGRPIVSLTTTPTSTPACARSPSRSRCADASGSSGSSASSSRATFDASTPAAAITRPCRVCTMRRSPRRATTRTVSASIAACRAASRRCGSAVPSCTSRSSALETILEVTTTTSPSCSVVCAAIRAARSSPGRTSPMPVTGTISTRGTAWSSLTATRPRAPHRTIAAVASSSVISNGTASTRTPGTSRGVGVVRSAMRRAGRRRCGRRSAAPRPRR